MTFFAQAVFFALLGLFVLAPTRLNAFTNLIEVHSLEWLTDSSVAIGIYEVGRVELESETRTFGYSKSESDVFHHRFFLDLRLVDVLKGVPREVRTEVYSTRMQGRVNEAALPVKGDRFLAFLKSDPSYTASPGAPPPELLAVHLVHLRSPAFAGTQQHLALTAGLQLSKGEEIERAVRARRHVQPQGAILNRTERGTADEFFEVELQHGTPLAEGLFNHARARIVVPSDLLPPDRRLKLQIQRGARGAPTALDVRISGLGPVKSERVDGSPEDHALLWTVRVENRSGTTTRALLGSEPGGGIWAACSLRARVWRAGESAEKTDGLGAPVFCRRQTFAEPVVVEWQPGQQREYVIRLNWRGTGSVMTLPLIDERQSGRYRISLSLDFLADGILQRAASAEQEIEISVP